MYCRCGCADLWIGDCVEVIESAAKPDVGGRGPEINLFYTTLGAPGTWGQEPNSPFFQKAVRRWRSGELPSTRKLEI
ncbi:hypothetical protein D3C85_431660 [compost metagenome]